MIIRKWWTAFKWKMSAYFYMKRRIGWARWDMVSSLYETYADWHPHDALEEDFSYWD